MNKVGKVLIVIGIMFLIGASSILSYNIYVDDRAKIESNNILNKLSFNIDKKEVAITDNIVEESNTKYIDGNNYVGIIYFPSLNIELPIINKWSYDSLNIAPSIYYGSLLDNNLVICAHSFKSHFKYLYKLNYNDKIIITDLNNNKYVYEVKEISIINPNSSSEVIDNNYDLVLFSCYNGGINRVVAKCKRVK